MSPEGPRFSPEQHTDGDGEGKKKNKNKRSKKNARLPVPLVTVEADAPSTPAEKQEKKEPSQLEKALAELAAKRADKETSSEESGEDATESGKDASPAESEEKEVAAETEEATLSAANPEEDVTTDEEDYEELPTYEPAPVEFSGGEVIIHLNGEEPVAERVIPLNTEASHEEQSPQAEYEEAPQPVFTPQPLQQHSFRAEQAPEPEVESEASGQAQPEAPNFSQAPVVPEIIQPISESGGPEPARLRDMAPFAPATDKIATKRDVEDALYYAEKAGKRQGALTGLLVGGAYEHFKHKRREQRAGKRFEAQSKEAEQERNQNYFAQQEQAKRGNEQQRQYNALEKRFEQNANAEKRSLPAAERTLLEQPEQLTVPQDHRLEKSAWHTIEVDSKTGKAVEDPTFAYGREYYQERAHESRPADDRNAAAGEAALTAITANGQGSVPLPQPLPNIPSASIQGAPQNSPQNAAVPSSISAAAPNNDKPASSSAPLWPLLVALVVIVVLLAILL